MHTNLTEIQVKPGKLQEVVAFCESIVPEASQIDGNRQLVFIVTGEDTATILAIYDTREQAEAGVVAASGVFSRMAEMLAEPPTRHSYDVPLSAML